MLRGFDMELLKRFLNKYRGTNKREKGMVLTDYCRLTGVKRDTASKRFRQYISRSLKGIKDKRVYALKRGRKRKYGALHKEIIKVCWELEGKE